MRSNKELIISIEESKRQFLADCLELPRGVIDSYIESLDILLINLREKEE